MNTSTIDTSANGNISSSSVTNTLGCGSNSFSCNNLSERHGVGTCVATRVSPGSGDHHLLLPSSADSDRMKEDTKSERLLSKHTNNNNNNNNKRKMYVYVDVVSSFLFSHYSFKYFFIFLTIYIVYSLLLFPLFRHQE
jgi:hypothetical protein